MAAVGQAWAYRSVCLPTALCRLDTWRSNRRPLASYFLSSEDLHLVKQVYLRYPVGTQWAEPHQNFSFFTKVVSCRLAEGLPVPVPTE